MGGGRTNFDYSCSFVTECHVCVLEMYVGAADAGVCDLDEDFVGCDSSSCATLDDLAVLRAFEDCEGDHC